MPFGVLENPRLRRARRLPRILATAHGVRSHAPAHRAHADGRRSDQTRERAHQHDQIVRPDSRNYASLAPAATMRVYGLREAVRSAPVQQRETVPGLPPGVTHTVKKTTHRWGEDASGVGITGVKPLTGTRKAVHDALCTADHPLLLREVMDAIGFSRETVIYHLEMLEKLKLARRTKDGQKLTFEALHPATSNVAPLFFKPCLARSPSRSASTRATTGKSLSHSTCQASSTPRVAPNADFAPPSFGGVTNSNKLGRRPLDG